ncbi:MAG: hypothetical protein LBE18_03205 [Planctomycetaceae bacterium]|jgi:hypothetical protein|nr:hypothetical protein [Planctomycetaceae bacterium]
MRIRDTDISKRQQNSPEEEIYAKFCEEVKNKIGVGTQDAMRKNLFVDFHRMGFINRYDKNKNNIEPLKKGNIKFVSLSSQGKKLITETDLQNRLFIFSKGLDFLLGGYINILLEIFHSKVYKINEISIYEFMFFVSAVNTNTCFNINTDECVQLMKAYRTLSRIQCRGVITYLQDLMQPKNYSGDKTKQRDFHNWKNKAEQVFSLIKQTVYFEQRDNNIIPKEIIDSTGTTNIKRLSRSLAAKQQYFQQHKVKKTIGFELHHIVPLSWAENLYQFKLMDEWRNMLYIDAFNHAKITQNRNRNICLSNEDETLILSDFYGNSIRLTKLNNVLYSNVHLPAMLKYNEQILQRHEDNNSQI